MRRIVLFLALVTASAACSDNGYRPGPTPPVPVNNGGGQVSPD